MSGATAPVAVSLIQLTFEQYDQLLDSAKMVCENLGFSDSGIDHAEGMAISALHYLALLLYTYH